MGRTPFWLVETRIFAAYCAGLAAAAIAVLALGYVAIAALIGAATLLACGLRFMYWRAGMAAEAQKPPELDDTP